MKYITTPIYYVNDKPHIGHAVTTLAADVLARTWRLKGDDVFFLTGTDEHGAKIAQAAEKAGKSPEAFVNDISEQFKQAWQSLNIQPDGFIRTTDPKHEAFVQEFLKKLHANDYIYKGSYKGWYCVGCEEFKTESQIGPNNTCPIHLTPLTEVEEESYLFRLSKFQEELTELITSDTFKISPTSRKNEVLSFIKEGLRDVAISRKHVAWGIQVPWDTDHTVYVWIDALLNYLSAAQNNGPDFNGKRPTWPPTQQLIGKDILRFHAVIWPALLLAAEEELPKELTVLGFFTVNGQKMSKSLGNVLAPQELIDRYGVDATRYLLLASVPFGSDGDISLDRLDELYTSDLANNLGNLVNRVQAMIKQYCNGVVPTAEIENLNGNFDDTTSIVQFLTKLNGYIQENQPWVLAKEKSPKLPTVLATLAEALFVVAIHISPILPETSSQILSIFGTSVSEVDYATLNSVNHTAGKTITQIPPLFPRLST